MSIDYDFSGDCTDPRVLYVSDAGHTHGARIIVGCNRRFDCDCPACSAKYVRKMRARYADAIRFFKHPKFLTLTLTKKRSGYDNLRRIWGLRKDLFRRLRELGYPILGWVACVEWPNHMHLVIDCAKFLPQWEVSKVWHDGTGDSYVVDIRALKRGGASASKAIHYITKYITKFVKMPGVNMDFFRRYHMVGSWGLVHNARPVPYCPHCRYNHPWYRCTEDEYYGQRWDSICIVPDDTGT